MNYEEAREALDRACEDWEPISSRYKLEKLTYEATCKKHHEEVQSSLDNTFSKLTNGTITIKATPILASREYKLDIAMYCGSGRVYCCECYPWASVRSREPDEEKSCEILFQYIRGVLGNMLVNQAIADTGELLKIASYIKLLEIDVKQNKLFYLLQRHINELVKESDQMKKIRADHDSWLDTIWRKTLATGRAWFEEGLCVPGMKAVLCDFDTREYFTGTVFTSKRNNALLVKLPSTRALTPLDSPKVCRAFTWLANNEKYRTIMQAIEVPNIADVRF